MILVSSSRWYFFVLVFIYRVMVVVSKLVGWDVLVVRVMVEGKPLLVAVDGRVAVRVQKQWRLKHY